MKYSPKLVELVEPVKEVMDTGFNYLNDYLIKLEDLNEANKRDTEEFGKCLAILTIVNDIMHPLHDLIIKMTPENKDFIEFLKERHKTATKMGLTMATFNKESDKKNNS